MTGSYRIRCSCRDCSRCRHGSDDCCGRERITVLDRDQRTFKSQARYDFCSLVPILSNSSLHIDAWKWFQQYLRN